MTTLSSTVYLADKQGDELAGITIDTVDSYKGEEHILQIKVENTLDFTAFKANVEEMDWEFTDSAADNQQILQSFKFDWLAAKEHQEDRPDHLWVTTDEAEYFGRGAAQEDGKDDLDRWYSTSFDQVVGPGGAPCGWAEVNLVDVTSGG